MGGRRLHDGGSLFDPRPSSGCRDKRHGSARNVGYGAHELRHNYTTLATRAAVPFMEQRMLMTHAVPGIAQVYTHPEALVDHLRQYAEAIEALVLGEAPGVEVGRLQTKQ